MHKALVGQHVSSALADFEFAVGLEQSALCEEVLDRRVNKLVESLLPFVFSFCLRHRLVLVLDVVRETPSRLT